MRSPPVATRRTQCGGFNSRTRLPVAQAIEMGRTSLLERIIPLSRIPPPRSMRDTAQIVRKDGFPGRAQREDENRNQPVPLSAEKQLVCLALGVFDGIPPWAPADCAPNRRSSRRKKRRSMDPVF